MQIPESAEQDENANDSIHESLERAPNVTPDSAAHFEKQPLPSISTDDGMQIDESNEQDENANDSIRESLERAPNFAL
jgi:hypothetical protein